MCWYEKMWMEGGLEIMGLQRCRRGVGVSSALVGTEVDGAGPKQARGQHRSRGRRVGCSAAHAAHTFRMVRTTAWRGAQTAAASPAAGGASVMASTCAPQRPGAQEASECDQGRLRSLSACTSGVQGWWSRRGLSASCLRKLSLVSCGLPQTASQLCCSCLAAAKLRTACRRQTLPQEAQASGQQVAAAAAEGWHMHRASRASRTLLPSASHCRTSADVAGPRTVVVEAGCVSASRHRSGVPLTMADTMYSPGRGGGQPARVTQRARAVLGAAAQARWLLAGLLCTPATRLPQAAMPCTSCSHEVSPPMPSVPVTSWWK
jgi:hypothetical protein